MDSHIEDMILQIVCGIKSWGIYQVQQLRWGVQQWIIEILLMQFYGYYEADHSGETCRPITEIGIMCIGDFGGGEIGGGGC